MLPLPDLDPHQEKMVVKILSSDMVLPSADSSSPPHPPTLWTSNLDLVILNGYIKTIYIFPSAAAASSFDRDIRRLRLALSSALSIFWPMAGRLAHDANDRLQIECNDAGALFLYASCDSSTIDSLPGGLTPNPNLLHLVPSLPPSNDLSSLPLLLVQVTKFKCGGVAVGVGIEHHVADGKSAVKFLNAWAAISRGVPFKEQVNFDRSCLQARTPPTPEFVHDEYLSLPLPPNYAELKQKKRKEANGKSGSPPNGAEQNGHVKRKLHSLANGRAAEKGGTPETNGHVSLANDGKVVENGHRTTALEEGAGQNGHHPAVDGGEGAVENGFKEGCVMGNNGHAGIEAATAEEKNGVKAAEEEKGKEDEVVVQMVDISKEFVLRLKQAGAGLVGLEKPLTSHEMLAAQVWKSVCEARKGEGEEATSRLIVAVDGRSRMRGLPEGYFGNVIFTSVASGLASQVASSPASDTALLVRRALRKLDDPYCRSALDFLELEPDTWRFVKGAHTWAAPNVGFTSWAQLPMYDCDFGWGMPSHVGPAHVGWDGLAYVTNPPPSSAAAGVVLRLIIALRRRHADAFLPAFLCLPTTE